MSAVKSAAFRRAHAPAVKTAEQLTVADLSRLGFVVDARWMERSGYGRTGEKTAMTKGAIRVLLCGEEGVEVFAFAETEARKGYAAVGHGYLAWEMRFQGAVPADLVTALLFKAVES